VPEWALPQEPPGRNQSLPQHGGFKFALAHFCAEARVPEPADSQSKVLTGCGTPVMPACEGAHGQEISRLLEWQGGNCLADPFHPSVDGRGIDVQRGLRRAGSKGCGANQRVERCSPRRLETDLDDGRQINLLGDHGLSKPQVNFPLFRNLHYPLFSIHETRSVQGE